VRLRLDVIAVASALVLALSACAGDGGANPSPTARPIPTRSKVTCPAAKPTQPKWPKEVPDFIPRPQGAIIDRVDNSKGNVIQVRFSAPISMDEGKTFILQEFPRSGLTLGRGDSEPTETDVQFQRNEGLRGLVRVFITREVCTTYWLLAVVRDTSAPYDISYTPPPSSTPLPFG
jgi:hypothetical protein